MPSPFIVLFNCILLVVAKLLLMYTLPLGCHQSEYINMQLFGVVVLVRAALLILGHAGLGAWLVWYGGRLGLLSGCSWAHLLWFEGCMGLRIHQIPAKLESHLCFTPE